MLSLLNTLSIQKTIMKKQGLSILFVALYLVAPVAMAIDIAVGTVLAYDRKARTMVFSDKTIWPLDEVASSLPANLKAGDRVEVRYDSDEDGVAKIISIAVLSKKSPAAAQSGPQDMTDGTVLALDRLARKLVLTDKTVWSLVELTSPLPVGLKAGDRIEIKFESDEDGVTSISSIRVLP